MNCPRCDKDIESPYHALCDSCREELLEEETFELYIQASAREREQAEWDRARRWPQYVQVGLFERAGAEG